MGKLDEDNARLEVLKQAIQNNGIPETPTRNLRTRTAPPPVSTQNDGAAFEQNVPARRRKTVSSRTVSIRPRKTYNEKGVASQDQTAASDRPVTAQDDIATEDTSAANKDCDASPPQDDSVVSNEDDNSAEDQDYNPSPAQDESAESDADDDPAEDADYEPSPAQDESAESEMETSAANQEPVAKIVADEDQSTLSGTTTTAQFTTAVPAQSKTHVTILWFVAS